MGARVEGTSLAPSLSLILLLTSCLLRSLSLVRMLAKCSLSALWPHRAAIWSGTLSLLATLLRKPALSLASSLGRVSLTFRFATMARPKPRGEDGL